MVINGRMIREVGTAQDVFSIYPCKWRHYDLLERQRNIFNDDNNNNNNNNNNNGATNVDNPW
jgi:hypothetical protein